MANLSVSDAMFWKRRLNAAVEKREVHRAIYDVSLQEWDFIQKAHKKIIREYIHDNTKVLDAGCGYGGLLEITPVVAFKYYGIDISPDFISHAQKKWRGHKFKVGDLRNLPFKDKEFDVAICRSVEGMVRENLGDGEWIKMERELTRVATQVLLLGYTDPTVFKIVTNWVFPDHSNEIQIEDTGRAIYRRGQAGTVELYDIFVKEEARRFGVATRLVKELFRQTLVSTIYGYCRATNSVALEFYKKLRAKLTEVPKFYNGVHDAFLFVLQKEVQDDNPTVPRS